MTQLSQCARVDGTKAAGRSVAPTELGKQSSPLVFGTNKEIFLPGTISAEINNYSIPMAAMLVAQGVEAEEKSNLPDHSALV